MMRTLKILSSIAISTSFILAGVTPVVANSIPLTIDGVINCANPDNAITTTCRGEVPPPPVTPLPPGYVPAPVPPPATPTAPPPAPAVGSMITYSGDIAIDCALEASKSSPICAPRTNPDGSLNCAQADNAITTTCWERAQADKKSGVNPVPSDVDCALEKFRNYPVCTGVAPQAVIDFEKTSSVKKLNQDTATALTETATVKTLTETTTVKSVTETAAIAEGSQEVKISGSVDLKSRNTKTTVLQIDLDLAKAKVQVIATKKGSPTLTQSVSADSNGNKTVTFKKNLKGYTIKIVVDGETIDSLKI